MIKRFCDRCKMEIRVYYQVVVKGATPVEPVIILSLDLCIYCKSEVIQLMKGGKDDQR